MDRWPDQIRLVDISLMPEFRGRSIVRMLMEGILAEGRSTGMRVSIHVEHDNPAADCTIASDSATSTPTASTT